MTELSSHLLLNTETATIRDVVSGGECRHRGAEECAQATHLVFPCRGVCVRHVGRYAAVAEANQALFFNAAESCRISHPELKRRRPARHTCADGCLHRIAKDSDSAALSRGGLLHVPDVRAFIRGAIS